MAEDVFYTKGSGRVFLPENRYSSVPCSLQFQQSTEELLKQIPHAEITKYDQNQTSDSEPSVVKVNASESRGFVNVSSALLIGS